MKYEHKAILMSKFIGNLPIIDKDQIAREYCNQRITAAGGTHVSRSIVGGFVDAGLGRVSGHAIVTCSCHVMITLSALLPLSTFCALFHCLQSTPSLIL